MCTLLARLDTLTKDVNAALDCQTGVLRWLQRAVPVMFSFNLLVEVGLPLKTECLELSLQQIGKGIQHTTQITTTVTFFECPSAYSTHIAPF